MNKRNIVMGMTFVGVMGFCSMLAGTVRAESGTSGTAVDVSSSIEHITVTATRLPRRLSEIAGTVSVISAVQMEKYLADDLDDLIRYQPGLSMDTAGRGGNIGFIIRGVGGNRVLTLIDGIPSSDIYSAGPSSYGVDSFEVDDLKAAEIIRGPASVLYGADAMGGTVLLRTKGPKDYLEDEENYSNFRASNSSADKQNKLGFTTAFALGEGAYMVQYTGRGFEEKELNNDLELNPQDGTSDALLLKSAWLFDNQNELTLALDFFQQEIDYILNSDLSDQVSYSLGRDATDRTRLSLSYEQIIDAAVANELDIHFYAQRTDALQNTIQTRTSFSFVNPINPVSFAGTQAQRVTDFEFNQSIQGFGASLVKKTKSGQAKHSIVYGFTFEQKETERPRNRCETELSSNVNTCDIAAFPMAPVESFPNTTFPVTGTSRTGVYVQDEIIFGVSGFTLIPGLRYESYEMDTDNTNVVDMAVFGAEIRPVDENELLTNIGLLYDVNQTWTVFLQYAEGFRPPNHDEANQAFVNYAFQYATTPNPELTPETSKGLELGVRANWGNAHLSFVTFDNDYEDFIESQFVGVQSNIRLYQDANVGQANIQGSELTVVSKLSRDWKLRAAVAYAKGDNLVSNTPLDSIEPLTSTLGLGYESASGKWGIETAFTWVDDKNRVSSDDRVTNESYSVVDVFGFYQLTEGSKLRLGVLNLFDEEYQRWSNIQGLAEDSSNIDLATETGIQFRLAYRMDF